MTPNTETKETGLSGEEFDELVRIQKIIHFTDLATESYRKRSEELYQKASFEQFEKVVETINKGYESHFFGGKNHEENM